MNFEFELPNLVENSVDTKENRISYFLGSWLMPIGKYWKFDQIY